jgi:exopolysaccharide biosynthesis predicted pyruvyltransferase EpsI
MSGRSQRPEPGPTELEAVLERYDGRRFALVEPGGNHGDTLIYRGLERVLDERGIAYESHSYFERLTNSVVRRTRKRATRLLRPTGIVPFAEIPLDDPGVVVVHGGGNVGDVWDGGTELLRSVLRTSPDTPVVVAPQTYWFASTDLSEVLADTTRRVRLFCREEYSHSLLTNHSLPEHVSVHLSPDTAFYLDRDHLADSVVDTPSTVGATDSDYDLLAFRDDRERIVPGSEIERLRAESDNPVVADVSTAVAFRAFVSLTEHADRVYTDRLHVAILGTILGTDVVLYENSYYKNRGVYEYSMADVPSTRFRAAV